MPEEKRKINAWIPISLYDKLENAGYENVTQALIKAIEDFQDDPQESIAGYKNQILGYEKDIAGYLQDITALNTENDRLKDDLSGYHRTQEGYKQDLSRIQKDLELQNQDIIGYKQDIKAITAENVKSKEDLAKAPDREELIKLQVTNEGLKSLLEEREKRIEEINSHYENIKSFANYFKSSESKQIEASAEEKKKPWYKIW
ncbi:MAG: hypothetical protein WCB90_02885 [Methanosarcina sp.]